MTRWAITVDRVVALLVGLVLIAVGVGALLWHTDLIPGFPQILTAPALTGALNSWWWRWAVAAAGVACTGLAVRWLAAHRPAGKAAALQLHDADTAGTVSIDPSAVADAAAQALRQHPTVRTAKGKARTDRGTRTLELTVTAAHPADLAAVVAAIDDTCVDIATATRGAPPLPTRATLHLPGGRALTRPRLE